MATEPAPAHPRNAGKPAAVPSAVPSVTPLAAPSAAPSVTPLAAPGAVPSVTPLAAPSAAPAGTADRAGPVPNTGPSSPGASGSPAGPCCLGSPAGPGSLARPGTSAGPGSPARPGTPAGPGSLPAPSGVPAPAGVPTAPTGPAAAREPRHPDSTAARTGLPPVVPGWPLLGVGPQLMRDPLAFLPQVVRRHGDALTLPLPHRQRLFLFSSPAAVEQLLVVGAARVRSGATNRAFMPFLGDGLLNLDAERHRRERAQVQPAFARPRIESYGPLMTEYCEAMLARWREGSTVDVAREMRRLTLRVAARALLGLDLPGDDEAFGTAFDHVIGYRISNALGLPQPHVDLPFTRWGRYLRSGRTLDGGVQALMSQRRSLGGDGGDALSMLLGGRGPDGSPSFTDTQVRDHAMTFLAAGHETTSSTLTFACHLLGSHPDKLARLRAELRAQLAGRSPTQADLERLPYLEAVVRESLRLYPPAWIMARTLTADMDVDGWTMPAGSDCRVSQWVMHRLPAHWPEPDRFLPERWLPGEGHPVAPYSYYPFGGGPRTCIGMPFALQEARLVLACILQHFEPEPLAGHRLRLDAWVTLRPRGGVPMRLRRAEA